MTFVLVALALPAAVCTAALRPAWPAPRVGRAGWVLLACFGTGGGLGLASCGFFLWYPAFGHPGGGYVVAELVALAALAALVYRRRKRPGPAGPALVANPRPSRTADLLAVPFAVLAVLGVRYALVYYTVEPHGHWDAYSFWNMRARFLFRAADTWRDAFSPLQNHPDYPLFVPATVTRCWVYAGAESTLAPFLVGLLMGALTVGLVVAALALLRGGGQGWLAGAALLGSHQYVSTVGVQYADVPLGFFMAAAVVAFALHDRTGRTSRFFPALAGGMAGLAAWTKNEGLLFLVALAAGRFGAAAVGPGLRAFAREQKWFALGLLPAALTLAYFKLAFAPPNDLVAGDRPPLATLLADWSRHEQILDALAGSAWGLGRYLLPVLAAYALLVGRPPADRRAPGLAAPALTLAAMLAGYYAVYLTTPHDLQWHLNTSADRLLVQLWPLAVVCYFLAVATPDEVRGGVSASGLSARGTALR
jgi:hypothetical protein